VLSFLSVAETVPERTFKKGLPRREFFIICELCPSSIGAFCALIVIKGKGGRERE